MTTEEIKAIGELLEKAYEAGLEAGKNQRKIKIKEPYGKLFNDDGVFWDTQPTCSTNTEVKH